MEDSSKSVIIWIGSMLIVGFVVGYITFNLGFIAGQESKICDVCEPVKEYICNLIEPVRTNITVVIEQITRTPIEIPIDPEAIVRPM